MLPDTCGRCLQCLHLRAVVLLCCENTCILPEATYGPDMGALHGMCMIVNWPTQASMPCNMHAFTLKLHLRRCKV